MSNEIVDLEKTNKIVKPYSTKEIITIDEKTGGVIEKETITVGRYKKADEFLKLFAENIEFLGVNLAGLEIKVFALLLARIGYDNLIELNTNVRKNIEVKCQLSRQTITKAIQGLIEKKILIKLDKDTLSKNYNIQTGDFYLANPNIIGKGSFKDLSKIRQIVKTEIDMKEGTFTKQIERQFDYSESEEVFNNPENYEIKDIQQKENETEKHTQVVIEQKEEANLFNNNEKLSEKEKGESLDVDIINLSKERPSNELSIELEIEKEKTKQMELDIKKQNNEILSMLISAKQFEQVKIFMEQNNIKQ